MRDDGSLVPGPTSDNVGNMVSGPDSVGSTVFSTGPGVGSTVDSTASVGILVGITFDMGEAELVGNDSVGKSLVGGSVGILVGIPSDTGDVVTLGAWVGKELVGKSLVGTLVGLAVGTLGGFVGMTSVIGDMVGNAVVGK